MSYDNCKHLKTYNDTVEYWGAMVSMPTTECAKDMDGSKCGEGCPEYQPWSEKEELYQRADYEYDKEKERQ